MLLRDPLSIPRWCYDRFDPDGMRVVPDEEVHRRFVDGLRQLEPIAELVPRPGAGAAVTVAVTSPSGRRRSASGAG